MSNSKDQIGGQIQSDTAERFERFQKERGLEDNQSEAMRRLVRRGLDAIDSDDESGESGGEQARAFASQLFVTLGVGLVVLGSWAMLSTSRAAASFGLLAGGVVAIGLAWPIHSGALPVVNGE